MALRWTCLRVVATNSLFISSSRGPAYKFDGHRHISGKANRVIDPKKPKPFPYSERKFGFFWQMIDKTTLRFDENTKLITIEGCNAIGKSKFAQELAEELGMLYVKYPCADDWYINSYGFDMRTLDHLMPERLKSYDEKDFARNPLGPVPGSADRFFYNIFRMKYVNYVYALRHIFNTGQGVVMEGSLFSDYAYFESALRQGWLSAETFRFYKKALGYTLHHNLRPNLIIYLDAPVETVIKNIQARGNEWDKNSPVWTNASYLSGIYDELKKNYLKKMQKYCRILAYDWTVPGDIEIVVDDIENLNMEDIHVYDDQQSDWRLHDEPAAARIRFSYTQPDALISKLNCMTDVVDYDCEHLFYTIEEVLQYSQILNWVDSMRYAHGFNEKLGDKGIWRKYSDFYALQGYNLFPIQFQGNKKRNYWFGEDINGLDYDYIMAKRKDGTLALNHNRTVLGF